MKSVIAAMVASIPGMVIGLALWTALAVALLAAYWIAYEGIFLGVVCGAQGQGRGIGLGWCEPPGPEIQQATREYAMFCTVFAFTLGEVVAAVAGGFVGGAAGSALVRLFAWVRRVVGRHPIG